MKKNSFIEGTFIATASIILVKILGMLYVVPFYIIVGMQGGALYSYAYNIYLIFLGISTAGVPAAISKIISEYNTLGMLEAKTRAYKLGKKFIAIFSFVAFLIVFVFAEALATLILGNLTGGNTIQDTAFVIRCVSLAILVIPYLSVMRGYLQGHNYITPSANANLIEQAIRIFIIIAGSFLVMRVFDGTLTQAIGIAVGGAFFGGIGAYWYLRRSIKKNQKELHLDKKQKKDPITNKEIIKKIGVYALPFIIINVVSSVFNFTDMVMVIRTLDYLGYSARDVEFVASVISTWGAKLTMIVNAIGIGITITLIPRIVEAFATKNWEDVNKKINQSLQMVIFVSLPLTLGLSILSTPVWTLFYNVIGRGGDILGWMIFNALIGNVYMIVITILQGLNKYSVIYRASIIGFISKVTLNIPLMILFNNLGIGAYYGAILSTTISFSISIYIGLSAIRKEHGVRYKNTVLQMAKMIIPAVLMVASLYFINRVLLFNVFSRTEALQLIIINTIIGGLIYIIISFKLRLPQHIFGNDELNNIIKKLTFGKFG